MHSTAELLKNLLRIITPEEISELTTTFGGHKRVPLTELLVSQMGEQVEESSPSKPNSEDGKAKILPFKKKEEDAEKPESKKPVERDITFKCSERVKKLLDDFLIESENSKNSLFGPKRRPKRSVSKKTEASTFIIEEKKKVERSVTSLKSREILSLYVKNAAVDVQQEKNNKDDFSLSSQSGVLVNKKQA